ncbi:hypothetical protein IV203_001723 [Nitzschia inconspicua]|uniref:Protein arginine N-methyltransferase n=1 Tax=Nitzschia inconspicua TaxID=303405 RepID=A0A9K3L794_9STRA|nr:hypothetical protein IV203_001723 [Nitzschia inconspicua]
MINEIAEALAKSKYSDLVHITLANTEEELTEDEPPKKRAKGSKSEVESEKPDEDAEPGTREILLTAKLDHENGGFRWMDVSATEDPIARHLRTKIWIFPMLNDDKRTFLYDRGIELAACEVVRRRPPGVSTIHALDIGSGTGLLAMMSAKYLQQAFSRANDNLEKGCSTDMVYHAKITSLEMSRPMAILARHISFSNGFRQEASLSPSLKGRLCETSIDVVEAHSCEFPPISEPKAMFCTSELLDSGLLGEGWLPAMRDAWERHLDSRAVVLPQRARVFAQVVEGISEYWGPHKVLIGFPNRRKMSLFTNANGEETLSDGSYDAEGKKHGVQVPIHLKKFLKDHPMKLLSMPIPVFEFDVSSKETIPGPEGRSIPIEFVPVASGKAEGVIFWWELDVFPGLTYTTNAVVHPWQDHWHACLYVFPRENKDCVSLSPGLSSQLIASHTDSRLHFDVHPIQMNTWRHPEQQHVELIQRDPIVSPRRCWILNNLERSRNIFECVKEALDKVGHAKAIVLDISDFPLCGMMAAMLGAAHVTSLESSSTDLPYMSAKVAQVANGLSPQNYHPDNFVVARCHPENLTTSILAANTRSNVVVGEPYYEFLEGHPVQEAFNFYNIFCMLKEKKVVCRDLVTMPCRAIICAQGIECPDLAKFYNGNTRYIGGFDHQVMADYWTFDQHPISIPLYEYDFLPATNIVNIATLDFERDEIEIHDSNRGKLFTKLWPSAYGDDERRHMHDHSRIQAEMLKGATACNAITFWVDYRARTGPETTKSVYGETYIDHRKYRPTEQVLILRTPHSSDMGPVTIPIHWMDAM